MNHVLIKTSMDKESCILFAAELIESLWVSEVIVKTIEGIWSVEVSYTSRGFSEVYAVINMPIYSDMIEGLIFTKDEG